MMLAPLGCGRSRGVIALLWIPDSAAIPREHEDKPGSSPRVTRLADLVHVNARYAKPCETFPIYEHRTQTVSDGSSKRSFSKSRNRFYQAISLGLCLFFRDQPLLVSLN